MNKNQGTGIIERVIYGIVAAMIARYGSKLGLTPDDAMWLTLGIISGVGSVIAWLKERPVSVLNRAGEAIPAQAKLVIETPITAPHAQRVEAVQLAAAASDKIIANT